MYDITQQSTPAYMHHKVSEEVCEAWIRAELEKQKSSYTDQLQQARKELELELNRRILALLKQGKEGTTPEHPQDWTVETLNTAYAPPTGLHTPSCTKPPSPLHSTRL